MTEHNLPGSGNSLVRSDDDATATYTEMQRCKHCLEPMSAQDALDDVCDDCLKSEKLDWSCNDPECEHSWTCLGIPMTCPVCNGVNIDSEISHRLDRVREPLITNYILKQRAA